MAVLVSVMGVSLNSCYGKYALFNKFHKFNGSIGDKWINSLVHFIASPVYGICLFADAVIFNLIEFWTGSNPIAMGDTFEETDELGNKMLAVKNEDGTLSVTMTAADGTQASYTLVRDDLEVRAVDAEGVVVAKQDLPYHNKYLY
jgi:hypothetical protein